jgi:hypothetical protein
MDQSREAHHAARPLHSPKGGHQLSTDPDGRSACRGRRTAIRNAPETGIGHTGTWPTTLVIVPEASGV